MSVTSTSRSEQVVWKPRQRDKLENNTTQDFEIDTVGVSTIELRGTTGKLANKGIIVQILKSYDMI